MNITKYKLTITTLIIVLCAFITFGQTQTETRELLPDQTLTREMIGAETHRYKFDLKENEFFQVRVEQKGVDVSLKLLDSDGKVLAEMDSPNGKEGFETLSFVADKAGGFVLEIGSFDAKAEKGSYTIKRESNRTATEKDKRRVEVERIFVEGMTARNTKGQQEIALSKLGEALNGWEELQDAYLSDLTTVNLFLLANQLPQEILKEAMDLLNDGKQESLLESRKQSFKALELFRRFYQQLDEKAFTDAMVKYNGDKATVKFTTKFDEINTLTNIANTYSRTGDFEESLKYSQLAIEIIKEIRSNKEMLASKGYTMGKSNLKELEASLISSIGSTLSNSLDKPKEALDYLNQALILFRELQKEDDESYKEFAKFQEVLILRNLGNSYNKLGNIPEALKFFEQALALIQPMPNQRSFEAQILSNIATAYLVSFNYEKSLLTLNQMSEIAKETGDKALQADALNYIKTIYFDLGDEKALQDYSKQEIDLLLSPEYLKSILTRFPASAGEFYEKQFDSLRLLRIGNSYKLLEEYENALKYYEQALSVAGEIKAESIEGIVLTQIADLYMKWKQWEKAIEYSQKSLAFERKRAIKSDLALALRDVGFSYLEADKPKEALPYFNESLAVWYSLGANDNQTIYRHFATTMSHISRTYEALGNRRLAIFYGKQTVNATQRERQQLTNLDQALQRGYLKKNEKSYRRLAEWLIEDKRIIEAEQVLAMLKDEEVSSYLRRDVSEADKLQQRTDLTAVERDALTRYNKIGERIAAIGAEYDKLRELRKQGTTLSDEQLKRYEELAEEVKDANNIFQAFLKQLAEEFAKRNVSPKGIEEELSLQSELKNWGEGVVFLYTLVGEDRYRVILTTPSVKTDGKSEISSIELDKKISDFRQIVQNPRLDPRPLGKELYDILIKPIEKQLDGAKAKTLLWSLDGNLRLLPIAALWDGKQYFGQKYQNVTVTVASRTRLNEVNSRDWRILGLGVSESKTVSVSQLDGTTRNIPFSELPAVKRELAKIVAVENSSEGVLPGFILLNSEFTKKNFINQLFKGYKAIHIASHFNLNAGDATQSFLLLGDGNALTVSEIKNDPDLSFTGVDLLTLSACDTAVGETDSNGKEVEGFAYVAQQNGAKAILATLWSVADESTALLMSEFYRLRKENPNLTKAEAIQLAQKAMIEGKLKAATAGNLKGAELAGSTTGKITAPPFNFDDEKPFAHPFYWSPFILIGNWK